MSPPEKKFKLSERLQSFTHAFQGLLTLWKEEHNARIHFIASITIVPAGIYFRLNTTEWCTLSIVIAMVISAELINSAIENIVDFISPEYHKQAGKMKDLAAAAVLVCALAALVVGILIFIPKISDKLAP